MNAKIRKRASNAGMPLMDFILSRIRQLEAESGIPRTIFAACPNSHAVIRAALKSARKNNAPIKFAATLNQVDTDGGYTRLTQKDFTDLIHREAIEIGLTGPVIVAVDHGGPWLKDIHVREKWSYHDSMQAVKRSFEAAVDAGYDLLHVDPTVDITLPKGQVISIDVVAARTLELIEHVEKYRKARHLPAVSYEVGTEEVHGGLADLTVFRRFLELLKSGLKSAGLAQTWPCFIVGKVGTDLHTTTFDPDIARRLTAIARDYGSVIKGHYTDGVTNPEAYPLAGMGAANIGPEFTEREYDGLMQLEQMQAGLVHNGKISQPVQMRKTLWEAVITSGRWKKWLQPGENPDDFFAQSPERQEWLIKTGCRYIWETPAVVGARARLYDELGNHSIDAREIVEAEIEKAMDKYFSAFNLAGLNTLI